MADFEFLSPDDKPALLAIQSDDIRARAEQVLKDAGYVVHTIAGHEEFAGRFGQANYQLMILDEGFGGGGPDQNETLRNIQGMAMAQRRHCTFILIGAAFESLNAMQAFQQSVHAVVNPAELDNLAAVVQKVVADNDTFLHTYREVLENMAKGG